MDDFLLPPSAFTLPKVEPSSGFCNTKFYGDITEKSISCQSDDRASVCQHDDLFNNLQFENQSLNRIIMQLREENGELKKCNYDNSIEMKNHRAYMNADLLFDINDRNLTKEMPPFYDDDGGNSSIEKLREENGLLNDQLRLNKIHLESLEKVLKLQEKQIVSKMSDSSDSNSEKFERTLKSWREQVLRLFIEMENLKAESSQAAGRSKRTCEQLKSDLDAMHLKLETNESKLEATRSALDAEKVKNENAQKTIGHLNEIVTRWQTCSCQLRTDYRATLTTIKHKMEILSRQLTAMFGIMTTTNGQSCPTMTNPIIPMAVFQRLRQLERRIEFATSRLPLIRTKLAILKSRPIPVGCRMDQTTQTACGLKTWIGDMVTEVEQEEILHQAQKQLREALIDRDQALEKLQRYVEMYDVRICESKKKVEQELIDLKAKNEDLQTSLVECQNQLEQTSSRLEKTQCDFATVQQTACTERSTFQSNLNDIQGKLAKSVIELKRAERRLSRQTNEHKIQIDDLENMYKLKIDMLENALRSHHPEMYQADLATRTDLTKQNLNFSILESDKLDFLKNSLQTIEKMAKCLESSGNELSDVELDEMQQLNCD